jgi:hypothetical protein
VENMSDFDDSEMEHSEFRDASDEVEAAERRAVLAERARIVAWLRAQGDRLCLDCPCYDAAASAIERGEHEEPKP